MLFAVMVIDALALACVDDDCDVETVIWSTYGDVVAIIA